jgi:hypothetical protein
VRLLKDKILTGSLLNFGFYSVPAPEMQALTLYELSLSVRREILLSLENPVQTNDVRWLENGAFWLFHVTDKS